MTGQEVNSELGTGDLVGGFPAGEATTRFRESIPDCLIAAPKVVCDWRPLDLLLSRHFKNFLEQNLFIGSLFNIIMRDDPGYFPFLSIGSPLRSIWTGAH